MRASALFLTLIPVVSYATKDIETPDFTLKLDEASQVAYGLLPKGADGFDFLPSDRLKTRMGNNFAHLGDLTMRVRTVGLVEWRSASTFADRKPVTVIADGSANLAPTLPNDWPIEVKRTWKVQNGRLVLLFDLKNKTDKPLEIGGLGIPMPFNNIISDRSLEEAHAKCSFVDPYIGADAGYLQVTRLTGTGPTIVVTPVGQTPLENYRLIEEPIRPWQTFEGVMEWMVHTTAYAEREWKGVKQWNDPTSGILMPGTTRTYGVQFTPSPSIRGIESTLTNLERPVAVGLPGYVLPQDTDAKLFLKYGKAVKSLNVEPKGAFKILPNKEGQDGWTGYTLRGRDWGQARLTVTYADGLKQTIHYKVIKGAAQAVADLGKFLTTKSWYEDATDPFGRGPSVMSYDRGKDALVLQDSRAWIAGLGDEGGSNWLAAVIKQAGQPNKDEIAKLEQFIDKVLWGNLQFKEGPKKFGVRKSVFYYEPKMLPDYVYDPKLNWKTWTSWNFEHTNDIGRGYNYPHVIGAYWAMYRAARNNPGMVNNHPWDWYLNQAYETLMYLTSRGPNGEDVVGYWRLGLMGATVFRSVLEDLQHEGWNDKAKLLEARMKERADRWAEEAFPFGSEMAWDSTGQEEVYAWCKYFDHDDKALVSLNSILAYMPTVPHWGYNGCARRYWDFLYGGKLSRIERQLHHYGSTLNALPVLTEYQQHPEDLYLLRVGYGGLMGGLTNIDKDGFASAAFHSFPSTLKWDDYSGDYGPSFSGHAQGTGSYLVNMPSFGWQAFGGNVAVTEKRITLAPRDSFRQKAYLAPIGLLINAESGTLEEVSYEPATGRVRVKLRGGEFARVRVSQPAKVAGVGGYAATVRQDVDAGAYKIKLKKGAGSLELSAQ